jgi:flavodoxin
VSVLVVYDTWFGNTARVAQAIADGIEPLTDVRILSAVEATSASSERPGLLIIGGPTQRHGLSPALAAYLSALPRGSLSNVPAASFDTRYRMRRLLSGSAAMAAARRLRRAGCRMVAPPESFFIVQDPPPKGEKRRHQLEQLELGELERAGQWGSDVWKAAQAQART